VKKKKVIKKGEEDQNELSDIAATNVSEGERNRSEKKR